MRIAAQQRFRLIEAVGLHPDVSGQVPGRRGRRAALADADTVTDCAAALEDAGLPELAQVRLPGAIVILVGIAIVVLVGSGLAAASSETTFWVVFWGGNAAGVPSLWSALYRGPAGLALERA